MTAALAAATLVAIALAGAARGISQNLPPGISDPPLPLGDSAQRPRNAADAVQFVYPAQVTITAQRPAVIDLHFHIAPGLHINSHSPHEKTLIPTRVALVEPKGVSVASIAFPPGVNYSFSFSPTEKLSVYSGDFTLHAHLTAQRGQYQLQGELHYQACDINTCMPPHTLPFFVSVIAN